MFITFEGIDGSGKSVHSKLLFNYLKKKHVKVILVREPGGTKIAEQIRNILLDKKNKEIFDMTEVLLFLAARSQLVHEKIKPALKKKYWVVCDRYVDSTIAYQVYGKGLKFNDIKKINNIATNNLMPDITFFLDAFNIKYINFQDRIEIRNYNSYKKIYDGYKKIARENPKRFFTIDTKCKRYVAHENILKVIDIFLKNKQNKK
ncbi:MAG: dTMP kinase [Clostridiales bacterium]|nr:dTMP kinase [Clostridiales bacterium]